MDFIKKVSLMAMIMFYVVPCTADTSSNDMIIAGIVRTFMAPLFVGLEFFDNQSAITIKNEKSELYQQAFDAHVAKYGDRPELHYSALFLAMTPWLALAFGIQSHQGSALIPLLLLSFVCSHGAMVIEERRKKVLNNAAIAAQAVVDYEKAKQQAA